MGTLLKIGNSYSRDYLLNYFRTRSQSNNGLSFAEVAALINSLSLLGGSGQSAYQLWLAKGNVGSEDDFLTSLIGATGQSAYQFWLGDGNAGTIQDFLDSLVGEGGKSTYQSWLDAGNTGSEEEFLASLIGNAGESAYELWLGESNSGTIQDFLDSLVGEGGKSAYQSWLDQGNSGTEAEFLTSLVGNAGDSAYELWLGESNAGTIQDFLDSLVGEGGKSAYQSWLDQGNSGSEADFVNSLKGEPGDPGSGGSATVPLISSIQVTAENPERVEIIFNQVMNGTVGFFVFVNESSVSVNASGSGTNTYYLTRSSGVFNQGDVIQFNYGEVGGNVQNLFGEDLPVINLSPIANNVVAAGPQSIQSAVLSDANPTQVVITLTENYSALPTFYNVDGSNNWGLGVYPAGDPEQQQIIAAGTSQKELRINLSAFAPDPSHVLTLDIDIDGDQFRDIVVTNQLTGSTQKRVLPSIPDCDFLVKDSSWAFNTVDRIDTSNDLDALLDDQNKNESIVVFDVSGNIETLGSYSDAKIEGQNIRLAGQTQANLVSHLKPILKVNYPDRNANENGRLIIENMVIHAGDLADALRVGDNDSFIDSLIVQNCLIIGSAADGDEVIAFYGRRIIFQDNILIPGAHVDWDDPAAGTGKAFAGITFSIDDDDAVLIWRRNLTIGCRERTPNVRVKHAFIYNNIMFNPQLRVVSIFSPKDITPGSPNSFATFTNFTRNLVLFGNQTPATPGSLINIEAEGSAGVLSYFINDNQIQLVDGTYVTLDINSTQYTQITSGGGGSLISSSSLLSSAKHPGFNPLPISKLQEYFKEHCGPNPKARPTWLADFFDDLGDYGSAVPTPSPTNKYNYRDNFSDSFLGGNPDFGSVVTSVHATVADPLNNDALHPLYSNIDIQLNEEFIAKTGKKSTIGL